MFNAQYTYTCELKFIYIILVFGFLIHIYALRVPVFIDMWSATRLFHAEF